jgi:hypothetical protein
MVITVGVDKGGGVLVMVAVGAPYESVKVTSLAVAYVGVITVTTLYEVVNRVIDVTTPFARVVACTTLATKVPRVVVPSSSVMVFPTTPTTLVSPSPA